jgi:hypothetical protein
LAGANSYNPHTLCNKSTDVVQRLQKRCMGSFRLNLMQSASSRKLQFHRADTGDSEKVVTSFVQDGIYPPRNFATFGPSELQPPFTLPSVRENSRSFIFRAPGRLQAPYSIIQNFAKLCVFVKQSLLLFVVTPPNRPSKSLKYSPPSPEVTRVSLPSSFDVTDSTILVFNTHPPVSV